MRDKRNDLLLALAAATALCGAGSTTAFAAPSLSQPGIELFDKLPGAEADVDDEQLQTAPPQTSTTETQQPATAEGAAETPAQPSEGETAPEHTGATEPTEAGEQPSTSQTGESAEQPAAQPTLFSIDAINLDAAELDLSTKERADIDAIFAEALHHELSLAELNQTIAKVTVYTRAHGYPASAAYLPAQESQDGTITVRVIPGRYGDVKLDNHSKLKDSVAMRFVEGLKKGEIIRSKGLETTLYSISDVSGTRAVGVLSPGKDFGTSDVTVRIEDGKQESTVLYAENYGSKSSGRYRYGLQQSFYDVGGTGAKANLGGMISNSHMHNYYANYELPIGRGGQTLGLGFSQMDYKLGGPFREWGANGKAKTVSLFGSLPFYHTHDSQLKMTYGYDYRKLEDDLDLFEGAADSEKHSHSVHVGVAGSQQMPKTSVAYSADVTHGTLTMDSDYAKLVDESAKTSGGFTKFTADTTVVQSLGHRTDVMVKASGQLADRNLDGSEQIYLGGANAVRAYPQGEASGDVGILGTAEFRYYTDLTGLVLSTYFDAGHVKLSKDGSDGGETLKGWGVAASYTKPGDWFARLDYARRIGSDPNMSEDAKSKGRVWFILGKIW
ncbi:MAG: ShlB/FhaC/HecB family hemolysin secretion/activation protein [Selenomonas sp.]|uniref:ShlB/FhaC/HecB family hemolysin secretion/activation protein n=1 Tax=Selenomonas sp. TaxID=2053611 RepID=UPI0025EDD6F5|nr:ShlB/FhaC/HecB family hemolysin secretion/activation protein [Selenomonas sp.]MCI6086932.1 ShlB/FhaC/HecB family hemolysin secretion/activation protein [Selenomonas sp.]